MSGPKIRTDTVNRRLTGTRSVDCKDPESRKRRSSPLSRSSRGYKKDLNVKVRKRGMWDGSGGRGLEIPVIVLAHVQYYVPYDINLYTDQFVTKEERPSLILNRGILCGTVSNIQN